MLYKIKENISDIIFLKIKQKRKIKSDSGKDSLLDWIYAIAFLWVNMFNLLAILYSSIYAETHHFIPNFISININFTFIYGIATMVTDEAYKYLNNCLRGLNCPNFSMYTYILSYEILLTLGKLGSYSLWYNWITQNYKNIHVNSSLYLQGDGLFMKNEWNENFTSFKLEKGPHFTLPMTK